jgi:hypothetical protein
MPEQSERFKRLMAQEGQTLELTLGRAQLQTGRTFSEAALDEANHELATWLGTRIIRRWNATREPPSYAKVTLTVEVG